jgi:hypothetical protein
VTGNELGAQFFDILELQYVTAAKLFGKTVGQFAYAKGGL